MQSYSTSDIAHFLNTERTNVNYYIRKGYLNAILVDGNWEILKEDYITFREEYYDVDKRNSTRGATKKLSYEQVTLLTFILTDLQNNEVSLKDFTKSYKDKSELVPQIKDYIIYKRDMCIRYDNTHKGYRYQKLADDYGLKLGTIQKIINQDKKE